MSCSDPPRTQPLLNGKFHDTDARTLLYDCRDVRVRRLSGEASEHGRSRGSAGFWTSDEVKLLRTKLGLDEVFTYNDGLDLNKELQRMTRANTNTQVGRSKDLLGTYRCRGTMQRDVRHHQITSSGCSALYYEMCKCSC
ncbi:uncharacterized protein LOC120663779 [Panicum virgatum]|uniref:Uncharacterized protein n=1 Tax=Panicum virgatum TaxID=38727 RepID=A0A8T0U2R4_PANVG|nr:uncharacterized protein LOC120663779 [Panicum virgatum]KAG2615393.1 hypothetical protein PVAP13_3NG060800 [Panicum virgatum]